jgi:hypothetical protein
VIKLKRFDEAVWFDYEPGIRFKIKPLSRADSVQIRLKCKRKIAIQGVNGEDNIIDDIDMRLVALESFRMALIDWQGVEIEGVEKPERYQVIHGLFEDQKIVDFILGAAFKINEIEEKKVQDELKNSESSQDGSSIRNA